MQESSYPVHQLKALAENTTGRKHNGSRAHMVQLVESLTVPLKAWRLTFHDNRTFRNIVLGEYGIQPGDGFTIETELIELVTVLELPSAFRPSHQMCGGGCDLVHISKKL